MATRTSVGSGLWSAAGTWNTGVPLDTDTAIIAAGHDVEFDVDMTAFAAGVTLTITGTLHASTTAGAYLLKMQADMTGAGTLRAGTSGTPYPDTCTFEIQRRGFQITATTMTLDLNCSEPTTKYIRLSGVEAAGQTVWSVDTNVTGEINHWKDGAIVRICDINFVNDNEERTIAVGGVAATTITVTSGLTAQKETGALVVLISRNVKITHTSNAGQIISGATGTGSRIFAEVRNGNAIINVANATLGGTISGASNGLQSCLGCTLSTCFAGNTNGFNGGAGNVLLSSSLIAGGSSGVSAGFGYILQGLITGVSNGLSVSGGAIEYGTISGCQNGISGGAGFNLIGATFSNTVDLLNVAGMKAFNTAFNGTTEYSGYNGANVNIANFSESIDHDQVANAYRAWTKGGIVDSDTGTVYTGRTRSYKHGCASASFFVFQNRAFTVQPSGSLAVQCYIRKSATMTYLPRVWILTPGQEPFISGSPAVEAIMTDSVDTWETLVVTYTNSGTSPIEVIFRTVAKNATGNVFFDPIPTLLTPETFSAFSVLQSAAGQSQTDEIVVKAGKTSQTILVFIRSSQTTIGGKTGLVFNSAGLTCYYARPGAAAVAVNLVTQTVGGAYSSGGFVEIDATNMPGWYRFDVPDAAIAAGVDTTTLLFKGSSGMTPLPLKVNLVAYDPYSASDLGLANLDATVSSRLASASYTAPPSAASIVSALLATLIETGLTFKNAMRLMAASAAAKLSGAATAQVTIRNAVADDKDRIIADVDANGNRTNVTYDLSD